MKPQRDELVATLATTRAGREAILLHDGQFRAAQIPPKIGSVMITPTQRPDLVQQIIPPLLRSGVHGWLILLSAPMPDFGSGDALIIPVVPGVDGLPGDVYLCIERILEAVAYFNGGDAKHNGWTPKIGLDSLASRNPDSLQAILLHSVHPLFDSALAVRVELSSLPTDGTLPNSRMPSAVQAIASAIEQTGLSVPGIEASERGGRALDAKVSTNQIIYALLKELGWADVEPEIVRKYRDVMDTETKAFLISAATVAAFFDAHPEQATFDYSVPAAGICKAIERELLHSLSPHVSVPLGVNLMLNDMETILRGIDVTKRIKKREVAIGGRDVPTKLKGALGLPLYDEIFKQDRLPEQLPRFRKLRNRVSHIDPLARSQYDDLASHAALRVSNQIEECTLGRILRWRKRQREGSGARSRAQFGPTT